MLLGLGIGLVLGRKLMYLVEESVYRGVESVLGLLNAATLGRQERGELGRVSRLEELNRYRWSFSRTKKKYV